MTKVTPMVVKHTKKELGNDSSFPTDGTDNETLPNHLWKKSDSKGTI
jgi:hypothetical protein